MKLRQIVSIYHGLGVLANINHTKIAYAVVKNKKMLEPIVTENSPKPTPMMKQYWAELQTAKEEEKEAIHKKNEATIKLIADMQNAWENTLDTVDVAVKLHCVNPNDYPDNLNARQLELLENLNG